MNDQLNPETNQNMNQGVRPKNYLVESILVTIFCCLPLGIVGIIFATQVNSKFDVGDFTGAAKASKQAKQFMMWGLITGVVVMVAYFAIFGTAIFAGIQSAGQ